MVEVFPVRSKNNRIVIAFYIGWMFVSIISSIYITEENYLKLYEFVIILLLFLSPSILYFSVRWIKNGESKQVGKEENIYIDDSTLEGPPLVTVASDFGIDKKLYGMMFCAFLFISGFFAEIIINMHMIDTVYYYGWGRVPVSFFENMGILGGYLSIFKIISGSIFLIFVAMSYTDAKIYLEGAGVKGIKCSVGMLFIWGVIPFANLVMPWRAFGALDRAAIFASTFKRGGELWNKKGYRKISIRSIFMGISFFATGISALLYNSNMDRIRNKRIISAYEFEIMANEINRLLISTTFFYALFAISFILYFYYLNINAKNI